MKYTVEAIWFNDPLPVRMDNANSPTALGPEQNKHGDVWTGEYNTETNMVKVKVRYKGGWKTYAIPAPAVRLMRLGGAKGKLIQPTVRKQEAPTDGASPTA